MICQRVLYPWGHFTKGSYELLGITCAAAPFLIVITKKMDIAFIRETFCLPNKINPKKG